MAGLVIRKKDNEKNNGLNIRDYIILLDGNEISDISGINLNMEIDEVNTCVVEIGIDEVEIDAEFFKILELNM